LFSIFGGANDLLSVTCDFAGIRADLAAIFGEARSRQCTVVTFTMPDPSSINPFGRRLRNRMLHFNDIVRDEAERYGVLVMDFQHYPIIQDPRLFSEDRLHGNELGHQRVAAAMAWRLGIEGAAPPWGGPISQGTGCTAPTWAPGGWRPPWPGGSASRAPTSLGPSHSLRRRPGCGLVNSWRRTSNGLDATSRHGSAGASGGPHTAPDLPRSGPR